jgi:hypothetical protein
MGFNGGWVLICEMIKIAFGLPLAADGKKTKKSKYRRIRCGWVDG